MLSQSPVLPAPVEALNMSARSYQSGLSLLLEQHLFIIRIFLGDRIRLS